jgi:hypothetical protein
MIFYTIKNLQKNSIFLCSQGIKALIVLLLCLLAGPVLAEQGLSLKADTSKKCAICHYKWVSTFFIEHRNTPIAHAEEKSLEMFSRELCISCHDSSIRDSRSSICNDPGHQVGRVPSKNVRFRPLSPLMKRALSNAPPAIHPMRLPKKASQWLNISLELQMKIRLSAEPAINKCSEVWLKEIIP